mmetsp:Transcript_25895/g.60144  ORF Transcript_25895/g.60144 Transcript_25895/m.60144 type:complete len:176 (+) Transcript_25895:34-561(+)
MQGQRLEMLKFKKNLPDESPFENFDSKFKQGPWHEQLADENVFDDDAVKEEAHKPITEADDPDHTAFDELPDKYPFNEVKGGHTWHEWKGESVMQALGETNALDDGNTDSASYELGEHSLGRPFHKFKPDKNPLEGLDTKEHEWGVTAKSIPDKNVWDGLSPDTGYDAEDLAPAK